MPGINDMPRFTQNLSRHEFACECGCGYDTADFALVNALQKTVYYFQNQYDLDITIKITSGCRCPVHNENIGGASKSKHVIGQAADFQLVKPGGGFIPTRDIYDYLIRKYPGTYGIGRYTTWIHLDVRNQAARWEK